MNPFTVLVELLVILVAVSVVLILGRGPRRLRGRLIGLQAAVLAAGTTAALLLPFRSLVAYYWQVWAVLIMLGATAGLGAGVALRWWWTGPGRARALVVRAVLLVATSAVLLVGLEACFRLFVVQSDAFLTTYSSRLWVRRHWHPVNALGYRDREPVPGRPRMVVLGDSFAAGLGIERVEDRFVDHLRERWEPPFVVDLVADVGWATGDEIEALRRHPAPADAVILAYFVNDIAPAAERAGRRPPKVAAMPAGPAGRVVEYSFFANFVYWRAFRLLRGEVGASYWDFLRSAFADEAVWREHRGELDALLAAADHARWLVVVFPQLDDVPGSLGMTARVAGHFRERAVPVIDLGPHLEGRPWRELVVSGQDGHPGPALHREVADLITARLEELMAGGGGR